MTKSLWTAVGGVLLFALTPVLPARGEQVNPQPRELLLGERLQAWEFDDGPGGWQGGGQAGAEARAGVLIIESTGDDPNVDAAIGGVRGPVVLQLRARSATAGSGEVFWSTRETPGYSPARAQRVVLQHDGEWHEYTILIDTRETIDRLRIDPGSAPGRIEIDWIRLRVGRLHPLEIRELHADPQGVDVYLRNHSEEALAVRVNARPMAVPASSDTVVRLPVEAAGPFAQVKVVVAVPGLPMLRRSVVVHRPDAEASWVTCGQGVLTVRVSRDGRGAEIDLGGERVAILAPLVRLGEEIVSLAVVGSSPSGVKLRGEGVDATLEVVDGELKVRIDSDRPCEGPVLRALGSLEQGLFAGLEYLGAGEASSSTLDIRTPEHLRYAPNPLDVTMPLMAFVTDRVAVAMTWREMTLQPVYATPNFLDGTADHRMALRGRHVEATLLLQTPTPVEELILWAVEQRGLPQLPPRPRSDEAQRALAIQSLEDVVGGSSGWGHAAEARWERRPYMDMVSTLWRLGRPVDPPEVVSGGSHLRNDAGYFLTGRGAEWLAVRRGEAKSTLTQQREDGSFRYEGKYADGHFEDTASGYCAWRAMLLLEYARLTGDPDVLAGGLKALEFMKRFDTPRGAQTHELPLHTPDLLGSAYLVWAFVRGYELTNDASYLQEARKWALSGIPFVYQWGDKPVMPYATIAAYGATDWYEPNWVGLPVQWCGVVYAYGLAMLAPHESTLDWAHLARGILVTAEQMQYPEGDLAGCLPDFFLLPEQRRAGPSINPCAVVSLRRVLDGELDAMAVAEHDGHRIVAPFPTTIENGVARIVAEAGVTYQILIDGRRVVDVASEGIDLVPLNAVDTPQAAE